MLVLLCAIAARLPIPTTNPPPDGVTVVSYQTFVEQVQSGNTRDVTIQGDTITADLARSLQGRSCSAQDPTSGGNLFGTTLSSGSADSTCIMYLATPYQNVGMLLPLLLHHGVGVVIEPVRPSFLGLTRLFLELTTALLILILINSVFHQNRGSSELTDRFSQLRKSRPRHSGPRPQEEKARWTAVAPFMIAPAPPPPAPPKSQVKFADVAGIDEARAELEEVVQFLRYPERFQRLGAHIPRGILLVGSPGTGKTLLARAVAGEADVPFFSMSASEFVEMFVGVGASRVRDLFQKARQAAPCVIFLDEIDAVGRKRAVALNSQGERDQTLNQLLVELDGFDSRSAVIVLAATNRVDMLDAALLRPGRFDRHINVSYPDRAGREAILRVHTRHTPLHRQINLEHLARLTSGMSGAELANLVNEAALCAARRDLSSVTRECFEEALERIQLGACRPLVLSEQERRIIAFRECGRALVAHYLPEADPVNFLTILPRGAHLGVTQFSAQEDRYNYNRTTLMARITVMLAGRAAVELAFSVDGVTTGAEDDLRMATALAWRMVTHWGMGKQVGIIFADYCEIGQGISGEHAAFVTKQPLYTAFGGAKSHTRYVSSPTMAAMIDDEVQRILDEGHHTACQILSEHFTRLTHLVDVLLEREQLDRQQFEAILQE